MAGNFAPRPSQGPHKLRECLPLAVLLRDRLRYALTYAEVKMIVMQRCIQVDGKVRTDATFPTGFMDVVSIERTKEHFRLLYDTKGRFVAHKIRAEEATYKLCTVKRLLTAKKGVPYAVTHDGRTVRYIHPDVGIYDTVQVDIATGKVLRHIKCEAGNLVMVTGGHNVGRVGTIVRREPHPGSIEIVHVKDARGHAFATRVTNVFVIGEEKKAWVSLPKLQGLRQSNTEDRKARLDKVHQAA